MARLAAARGRGEPEASADHVRHWRASAGLTEWEVPWLAGYRGSKPVRIGNAAHAQLQLDVFGEMMDALYQARQRRTCLRTSQPGRWSWRCSNICNRSGSEPDDGIWEMRGPPPPFHLFQDHGLGRVRSGDQERGGVRHAGPDRRVAARCERNP